jgi:hypothetical protein
MKLSKAEHKIKRDFAERQIQPNSSLWNNIQQELDQEQSKPKTTYLWWKIGSVAALLCLVFLAYKSFQSRPDINSNLVLDSKKLKSNQVAITANPIGIKIAKTIPAIQKIQPRSNQFSNPNKEVVVSAAKDETKKTPKKENLDYEVDRLLAKAKNQLKLKKEDQQLIAEVNKLIEDSMSQTEDPDQKQILEGMKAEILLAEVESEIELDKPPLLKFEIWDAIVSNFNHVKDKFALN